MNPDILSPEVMSTAELVLFWIVAPIAVVASSALLFAKRAVVAAVCVVATMVCLAVLYVALDAPFLGIAQVVVYTGAIMMLFVFVIMLVGVDVADSFTEAIRGQRLAAVVCALGLGAVLIGAVVRAVLPDPVGIPEAESGGNPGDVAALIFSDYPFTLELVGTLLIVAAVGAVVLTHRRRLEPKKGQKELSVERVAAGTQVTPYPAPGVYAGRNAVDVPAIDAAGRPLLTSVPESVRVRGQVQRAALPPVPPPSSADAGPVDMVEPPTQADPADLADLPPSSADAGPPPPAEGQGEEKGGEE
jgi:NADH-quinone oxidoreductase subunit J